MSRKTHESTNQQPRVLRIHLLLYGLDFTRQWPYLWISWRPAGFNIHCAQGISTRIHTCTWRRKEETFNTWKDEALQTCNTCSQSQRTHFTSSFMALQQVDCPCKHRRVRAHILSTASPEKGRKGIRQHFCFHFQQNWSSSVGTEQRLDIKSNESLVKRRKTIPCKNFMVIS